MSGIDFDIHQYVQDCDTEFGDDRTNHQQDFIYEHITRKEDLDSIFTTQKPVIMKKQEIYQEDLYLPTIINKQQFLNNEQSFDLDQLSPVNKQYSFDASTDYSTPQQQSFQGFEQAQSYDAEIVTYQPIADIESQMVIEQTPFEGPILVKIEKQIEEVKDNEQKKTTKFGRPFKYDVEDATGEEKYACYRKSVLRSMGKIIKNLKKHKSLDESIKQDLKKMTQEDKKIVEDIIAIFKKIKCKKVEGTEFVWEALYAWNRKVKEIFFSNSACAYLFIKAIHEIEGMQKMKSYISKDNSGKSKKTKGIEKKKSTAQKKDKKEKEILTPEEKFDIYCDIIEEYKDLSVKKLIKNGFSLKF